MGHARLRSEGECPHRLEAEAALDGALARFWDPTDTEVEVREFGAGGLPTTGARHVSPHCHRGHRCSMRCGSMTCVERGATRSPGCVPTTHESCSSCSASVSQDDFLAGTCMGTRARRPRTFYK